MSIVGVIYMLLALALGVYFSVFQLRGTVDLCNGVRETSVFSFLFFKVRDVTFFDVSGCLDLKGLIIEF